MTEVPSNHEPTSQVDPLRRETYDAIGTQCIRLVNTAGGSFLRAGDRQLRYLMTNLYSIPEKIGAQLGKMRQFSLPGEDTSLRTRGIIIVLNEVPSEENELATVLVETFSPDQKDVALGRSLVIKRDGSIYDRGFYRAGNDDSLHPRLWKETEKWGFLSQRKGVSNKPMKEDTFEEAHGIRLLTKLREVEKSLNASVEEE